MACNDGKDPCGYGDAAQDAKSANPEVKTAEGPSDLLYKRMHALGVSSADIDRFTHGLTTELEKSCACCAEKAECREDLAHAPDDPHWKSYCPNVHALDAGRRLKGRFPI